MYLHVDIHVCAYNTYKRRRRGGVTEKWTDRNRKVRGIFKRNIEKKLGD